jgi:hypothetical protein
MYLKYWRLHVPNVAHLIAMPDEPITILVVMSGMDAFFGS